MMEITVSRVVDNSRYIFGAVRVGGELACLSLELPWLSNKPRVSCIPSGNYSWEHYESPKAGSTVIAINGVPGRSYIQIHAGNSLDDTEGCILVGMGIAIDQHHDGDEVILTNSRGALAHLLRMLEGEQGGTVNVL